MPAVDGRQCKVDVLEYELVEGQTGPYNQLVWRLRLPCGHWVTRASGREARPREFGARSIGGKLYVGVARRVACDVCLGRSIIP